MPNNCYNFLIISDVTHDQWRDFAATFQVRGDGYQQDFLKTFYPEPDYSVTPVAKTFPNITLQFAKCEKEREQIQRNQPTIREDSCWDWRVQHWGTKWDVYDCFNDWENEVPSDEFSVGFSTAGAPPSEECLAVISRQFPGSLLNNSYQEEGADFFGVTIAKDGVVNDFCDSLSKYREPFVREQFPDLDARPKNEGLNLENDLEDFFWDNCDSGDFSDYIHAAVMEVLVPKMIQEVRVSS